MSSNPKSVFTCIDLVDKPLPLFILNLCIQEIQVVE
jgi:hypothetical protein